MNISIKMMVLVCSVVLFVVCAAYAYPEGDLETAESAQWGGGWGRRGGWGGGWGGGGYGGGGYGGGGWGRGGYGGGWGGRGYGGWGGGRGWGK